MVATFGPGSGLEGAQFKEVNLRGARFVEVDLSGTVVRGSELQGLELDSPWLFDGNNTMVVNGVDVLPYVEAELNRRFPGRELQWATDPEGLRAAWAALEATWAATIERVAGMPEGTVDVSVDGEWSFADTLRHLVMATDAWLGRAILEIEQPFHPLGLIFEGGEGEVDRSLFVTERPAYADVLEARTDRNAMVRDYLAKVTQDELDAPRKNPWNPNHEETTRHCLHTILEEGWEHHRFAVRDLAVIESRG
ncbi:DinB family protein [Kribbella sp. NPDC026611]|uniref:DinB family protein n=1 Tax=Kribbella sp. NPDC026611 TaxID=3154911 RepID=UPI0033CBE1CF